MLEKYMAYMRHNPKGYWFKRKLYGWGWTPVAWQGWVVTGVYIAVVIGLTSSVNEYSSFREIVVVCVLPLVVLTGSLLLLCYAKGEKPKWQWGSCDDVEK